MLFNICNFRGVFLRDNLPKKPLAIECESVTLTENPDHDFNNDIDYFGIKSTEKITFDIWIDQIDFRTTIFSNGTIRFNVENSIEPLLGSRFIQQSHVKSNIDSIAIQLVDQDHNPINNLGEKLIIDLHIKRYGS
ncbi:Uncharacterized protein FWK35_00016691 [Aphis craccivora]|uniref:Uncharacterized protein n=1 Tax=Aphis craccivora TaxID=307492 RepID=A0A6G0Y281_APHCR|nr:Uncharacterized protein FWK35_00016691 [Aphis craccivora]